MFYLVIVSLFLFTTPALCLIWRNCGEWTYCDWSRDNRFISLADNPNTSYAHTDVLEVIPSPIRFGENISLDAFFTAKRQLPLDSVIGLEIWRHFSLFGMLPVDVRMPCVFGNGCRSNLCRLIDHWPFACELVKRSRNSDSCECPIEPGIYGQKNLVRRIPDASGILKVFGAGTYNARVRVIDSLSQEVACILITESVY